MAVNKRFKRILQCHKCWKWILVLHIDWAEQLLTHNSGCCIGRNGLFFLLFPWLLLLNDTHLSTIFLALPRHSSSLHLISEAIKGNDKKQQCEQEKLISCQPCLQVNTEETAASRQETEAAVSTVQKTPANALLKSSPAEAKMMGPVHTF